MPTEPFWRRYRRFWGPDLARDVDDELAFHIAMRVEELMRTGLSEPQARTAALQRFGDYREIREECRVLGRERQTRADRAERWAACLQDLRYAARGLIAHRGFALAVVLTMAIGIGANSAVFSVAYGVLLRPLPYRDQDRLVRLWSRNAERGLEFFSVSPADFAEWRREGSVFSGMAAFERQHEATLVRGGNPEPVQATSVTPDLIPLLGTPPARGRSLTPDDARPGALGVALLSDDLWRARFGGDPGVIGGDLTLDGRRLTVVGIMPPRFTVPGTPAQIWTPLDLANAPGDHGNRYLRVLARLKPGATLADARTRLDQIAARLAAEFPATNAAWTVNGMSVGEMIIGPQFRSALLALLGVVAFVLLIACSNAANLQLARASARRREIAIRSALGAGRGRLARQILTESVTLCGVAGLFGLLLAYGGISLLRALGAGMVPRLEEVRLDAPVLLFTMLVTLLGGLLFGLVPALRASRADPAEVLKEGGRGGGEARGRSSSGTRSALIISEVSLSLVLLIGAGLLMRSFARLQAVDLGFDPRGVALLSLRLPDAAYPDSQRISGFYDAVLDRVRGFPGVQSAALVSSAPFAGPNIGLVYTRADRAADPGVRPPDADYRVITPGYLRTMGTRLVRGRDFGPEDHPGAAAVALVSEALAREAWPGEEPLGQRLRINDVTRGREVTVVGVVADMRYQSFESPAPRPMLYLCWSSNPQRAMMIALRGGDPRVLAGTVRGAVTSIDPTLPAPVLMSMESLLQGALATPRFALVLFAAFAGAALVLVAIGIYGVMSYVVRQRTQEMGIRIALGASALAIIRMVMGRALGWTGIGVAIGLVGAWALTRSLASLLFGVSPTDPASYICTALLLGAVAALGSLLPAWRATRANPLDAIRGIERGPR